MATGKSKSGGTGEPDHNGDAGASHRTTTHTGWDPVAAECDPRPNTIGAAIDPELHRLLNCRSDRIGLACLAVHLGALASLWAMQDAAAAAAAGPGWAAAAVGGELVLAVATGVMLTFLFCPIHECLHHTAFRSRWLNDAVAAGAGALLLLPPLYFRLFHWDHHRHVQDPERDPEIRWSAFATKQPTHKTAATAATRADAEEGDEVKLFPGRAQDWVLALSGYGYWLERVSTTLRYALGRCSPADGFVRQKDRRAVIDEARRYCALYLALLLAGAAAPGTIGTALLRHWVVPALLGQPFLRLYLMYEHSGCELDRHRPSPLGGSAVRGAPATVEPAAAAARAFRHSRSWADTDAVFPRWVVLYLFWNMPYHAEHHMLPAVPFHALPGLRGHMLAALRRKGWEDRANSQCNRLGPQQRR